MAFNAFNNAPCGAFIGPLYDISSETVHGPQTTNPPDVQAIGQLTNYILVREPDWAPLLWINWDGATTLTVQVRDFYTLAMAIAASPWWTYWPAFPYDAAENIIGAIYLMQLTTPKFGASSDNITISDIGLTATRTTQTFTVTPPAGVPPQTALSTPSAVGQVYAEIQMHLVNNSDNGAFNTGIGIANSAQELMDPANSWLGSPAIIPSACIPVPRFG